MAEQELQKQLVNMITCVLSEEKKEVKDLVLLLLSITMQKSKNIHVEATATSALEAHFKKSIQAGILDLDDIDDFDIDKMGM